MKLLKPSWVHHDDNPIFSIDVHPDSSRLATGGQGQDSGIIVIWNMGPIVDKNKENDKNAPKKLCQMEHHIACVNVVRWSNNGLFLASGSDDKLIMIWQYVQCGPSYENIENWKCGYTLRGHSGDVLDLSWSSTDQYMASCSVDNTIIVWNAQKFPDIICRINAHAGLVKGVAWDPVGKYFASQSDDKTLKIWKTLDWTMEKSIEEPFKQCAGTTHVLRLSWSPDGQLVVSAHAINNGAPTAQVIDRGNNWSTKLDFVGHRKAVTAVRFFPQILKPHDAQPDAEFKTHCLCAVGSRDRSISLWLTNYSRALCIFRDVFDNPIMDLTWTRHPKPGLLACSMDGTIAYIELDYGEIGRPLTKSETEEFFMKKYNHDMKASAALKNHQLNGNTRSIGAADAAAAAASQKHKEIESASSSHKFIENLDILLAQEQQQSIKQQQQQQLLQQPDLEQLINQPQSSNENSISHMATSVSNTPSKIAENQKQIERRMPDGRRRITPICISKPGEYDKPKPFVGLTSAFLSAGYERSIGFDSPSDGITSKTATEHSTIIVEKRDERNEVLEISPVKSIIYTRQASNAPPSTTTTSLLAATCVVAAPSPVLKPQAQPLQSVLPLQTVNEPTIINIKPAAVQPTNQPQQHPAARKQLLKEPSHPTSPATAATLPTVKQTATSKTLSAAASAAFAVAAVKAASSHTTQATSKPSKQAAAAAAVVVATTSAPTATTIQPPPLAAAMPVEPSTSLPPRHQQPQQYASAPLLKPLRIDENFLSKLVRGGTGHPHSGISSLEIHNSISLFDKTSGDSSSLDAADASSSGGHNNGSQLSCLKYVNNKSLVKWQCYFYSRICEVATDGQLIACALDDSTLSLIRSDHGTQLSCPIQLNARAAVLRVNAGHCMCLTTSGHVYAWKCEPSDERKSCLATLVNCQPCEFILRDSKCNGEFLTATLTETGTPILIMAKNRSFFYSLETQCWHVVPSMGNLTGDGSHLFLNAKSVFSGSMRSALNEADDLTGPLSMIQSRTKTSSIIRAIELMNKASISKEDLTLTHLESQLNAALGLHSVKEYKFWLMTYTRYLVENNYEDKLTELCNFMLGPISSLNWTATILTHKKHDLLSEMLTIVAQDLRFQRFYTYCRHQLSARSAPSVRSKSVLDRLNNAQQTVRPHAPPATTKNSSVQAIASTNSRTTSPPKSSTTQRCINSNASHASTTDASSVQMEITELAVPVTPSPTPIVASCSKPETSEEQTAEEQMERDIFKMPQDPTVFKSDRKSNEASTSPLRVSSEHSNSPVAATVAATSTTESASESLQTLETQANVSSESDDEKNVTSRLVLAIADAAASAAIDDASKESKSPALESANMNID